jgi:hypothetical protein
MPDLLPAALVRQMRQAVAVADPFGLADGWGLGWALFRDGGTEWVGHDGNSDGTSCYLRVDPAGAWAIALTTNANTGVGLWRELLTTLTRMGVPIGRAPAGVSRARIVSAPRGCAGTYVNGDMEYMVAADRNGNLSMAVDGDAFTRMTFHKDMTFSVLDPDSGQPVFGGRFGREPTTGEIDRIQVGGRVARRRLRPHAMPTGNDPLAALSR